MEGLTGKDKVAESLPLAKAKKKWINDVNVVGMPFAVGSSPTSSDEADNNGDNEKEAVPP